MHEKCAKCSGRPYFPAEEKASDALAMDALAYDFDEPGDYLYDDGFDIPRVETQAPFTGHPASFYDPDDFADQTFPLDSSEE